MPCVTSISRHVIYLTVLNLYVGFLPSTATDDAGCSLPPPCVSRSNVTSDRERSVVTLNFRLKQGNDTFGREQYERLQALIARRVNQKRQLARESTTESTTNGTSVPSTAELTTTAATTEPATTEPTTTESITTEPTTISTTEPTTVATTTPWVPSKRRRRQADPSSSSSRDVKPENVHFVELDPKVKDGVARVSVFIDIPGEDVPEDLLYEIINELYEEDQRQLFENELGHSVDPPKADPMDRTGGFYKGLPEVDLPTALPAVAGIDWRFYLAFVLLIAILVILVLAIFCVIRRKPRIRPSTPIQPERTSQQQPLSSPLLPNGHSNPPYDDYDDGWITTYDHALSLLNGKTPPTSTPEVTLL